MPQIEQTYHINAPAHKVWQALTDPALIEQWSGTKATMNDQVGTKFSLWDGDMHGTNTEAIEDKLLIQDWFGGDWGKPSHVEFTLQEDDGKTILTLVHDDLPDDEVKEFADGWKEYYLGPLKELVETEHE